MDRKRTKKQMNSETIAAVIAVTILAVRYVKAELKVMDLEKQLKECNSAKNQLECIAMIEALNCQSAQKDRSRMQIAYRKLLERLES